MLITKNDAVISLDLTESFNRYVLTYTADVPMRCALTYAEEGGERVEEFFLEAGENATFASYVDGYLRHRTAKAALNLTVRAISREGGEFTLHSFTVETHPVLAEKTFYFENDRYKVGVELCWGGGLSYLEDKKCPVEGLVNILNNFDTGCFLLYVF